MTTNWSDLVTTTKVEKSAFEKGIGGSDFFKAGKHENVMIASVEPKVSKAGNNMVVVTYENDLGHTINAFVLIEHKDKKTGEMVINGAYRGLAAAILGMSTSHPENQDLRNEFFTEHLLANPQSWEKLVGARLNITVKPGDTGSTINTVGGEMILFDVETQEQWIETPKFENYSSAKEYRDKEQIPICYNGVSSTKVSTGVYLKMDVNGNEEEVTYMSGNVELVTKALKGPKPMARPVVSI